jgi:hypothetical protein
MILNQLNFFENGLKGGFQGMTKCTTQILAFRTEPKAHFRLETLLNKCCQLIDKDRPQKKKCKYKTKEEQSTRLSFTPACIYIA